MKLKFASLLGATMLAITTPVMAHMEHGQPQYGGIFGEAGAFQLELVPHEYSLTIYATLHGVPLSTKGATGKVTILGSSGKMEADLIAAGDNQLVAKLKTKLAAGSKVVANVVLPGKSPANVRFELN